MVIYTICRKTGRTLKADRADSPRDVTVKQVAVAIANIMPAAPAVKGGVGNAGKIAT